MSNEIINDIETTEVDVTDVETTETAEVMDPETVYAQIVKREDGYHVIDFDGTEGPVCNRRTTDGYIILTPNKSNRKCYNEKNAEKFFAENPDGAIDLYYKASRKIGSSGPRIPNEKLISYLPEAEQEEYRAIIARAMAAKEAAKVQPKTELEKAEARLAKAKAAYEKMLAEAAGTTDAE